MRRRDRLHWALAWLVMLIALCALTATAGAQLGPSARFGAVTEDAKHYLDSLADVSRRTRKEQAAWRHAYWIEQDTLTLVHFKPPTAFVSDSMNLTSEHDLCPMRVPVLHTHVAVFTDSISGQRRTNPNPSTDDMRSTMRRGTWGIVLVVDSATWRIVVYP